jgi:hypothetical protein
MALPTALAAYVMNIYLCCDRNRGWLVAVSQCAHGA